MGSYLQMGHHSENLLQDPACAKYSGVILSPVNRPPQEMAKDLIDYHDNFLSVVFDPQLYCPTSEKGNLPKWGYFPDPGFDSSDLSQVGWWSERAELIKASLTPLGGKILDVLSLASPIQIPRVYSDSFYETTLKIADQSQEVFPQSEILPTIIVNGDYLSSSNNCYRTASILSGSHFDRFYFVIQSNIAPRYEISDESELTGICQLIRLLSSSGKKILVSHTSTDSILWRCAGASDCATGKYFNTRRFTTSRFDPPAKGGGQIPYWIEEQFMAFLREPDMVRLNQIGMLSNTGVYKTYYNEIMREITGKNDPEGKPKWLALSWRQYLAWFEDAGRRLSNVDSAVNVLTQAHKNWGNLQKQGILVAEPTNDGSWIASWVSVLKKLPKG